MGLVTNGLKVAGLLAGKKKYKIMIVAAQLGYMGVKYILRRKREKNASTKAN